MKASHGTTYKYNKEKRSKVLLALMLALVMVMATACAGGDNDIKRPADVNGDSSVTSGNKNAGNTTGEKKKDPVANEITIAEPRVYACNPAPSSITE